MAQGLVLILLLAWWRALGIEMRHIFLLIVVLLCGAWVHGAGIFWRPLLVGGGGFVTGLQIYSGGAQVARTDSAGALYRSSYTAIWKPLVTHSSMPSDSNTQGRLEGACAVAAAPSNTNHIYLYFAPAQGAYSAGYAGYVYSSTDGGATFTKTGFGPVICNPNDSTAVPSWRLHNYAMQVDPQNENVAYLGTPGSGVYYTLNGGTFWTQISTGTIPAGTTPSGAVQGQGNLIYFDPSDGTGNTVYISAYGTGIYKCTSAATAPSCSELNSSGMPTTFSNVVVDQDGTLWVVDNQGDSEGSLYRYLSGTWSTQVAPSLGAFVAAVAINPSNANDVYAVDFHGFLNYSTNGQAATPSWSGYITSIDLVSSLIPWIQWAKGSGCTGSGCAGMVAYSASFDTARSNVLEIGEGIGVATTTPPTSGTPTVTWNANETAGIENLVGEMAVPLSGGGFIASAWDRPLWVLNDSGSYPTQYYPNAVGVVRGYTACANGTEIGIISGSGLNVSQNTGLTWGGYVTNSSFVGGLCALLTSSNWIWNGFKYTGSTVSGPYFTNNSGASWSACTFSNGATATGGGWGGNYGFDPIPEYLAFDPVSGSTLQYNDGGGTNTAGIYKLTTTASCAFTYVGAAPTVGGSTRMLYAIPGESSSFAMGGIAFAQGTIPDTSAVISISRDSGSTWNQVANLESPFAFGFGAALSGSDGFPTLYCACYVNTGGGYAYGMWQGENVDGGSPVWTKIGDGYPGGSFDLIVALVGDLATPGIVYGVFGGGTSFFVYGPQG